MEKYCSFVLVPSFEMKEGEFFKVIGEGVTTFRDGQEERVIVIGLKCGYKSDIPSFVLWLSTKHMEEMLEDNNAENVTNFTWSSWCYSIMDKVPQGVLVTKEKAKFLQEKFGVTTNRFDLMYLPSAVINWLQHKAKVAFM